MTSPDRHEHGDITPAVDDWLQERVAGLPSPDRAVQQALIEIHVTPQARARSLGRWFDRGASARRRAGDHDHPPETRRNVMISLTALVTAFAMLAIAVNVFDTQDTVPPGAEGSTLYVAADGTGQFSSIAEAVEAADDGDTIRVRPGLYTGTVRIDKDVDIRGFGADRVFIEASQDPADRAMCELDQPDNEEDVEFVGCAFVLVDTNAGISGLTLRGDYAGIIVYGGAPRLRALRFERIGEPYGWNDEEFLAPSDATNLEGWGQALTLRAATMADVRSSEFISTEPIWILEGAAPTIEDNELRDGSFILLGDAGDGTTIRGNDIHDSYGFAAILFGFDGDLAPTASVEVHRNRIYDNARAGIQIETGGSVRVRANTITDNGGNGVWTKGDTTIIDNTIDRNSAGVLVTEAKASLQSNDMEGNLTGVIVSRGAPHLSGNHIRLGDVGLRISGAESAVTLDRNVICENDVDLALWQGAPTPELAGNQVCITETVE